MFGPVALVHDWLTSMRGGERVLEALCELFPEADVFTLRCDRDKLSPALASRKVTTSFVDRAAPWLGGRFRALLPLFPRAVESFRLDRYRLVISSSHCVALGALAPAGALHVAYVHSPMRYVREAQPVYEAAVPFGSAGRWLFRGLAHYLRRWDDRAAARPHVLVANSHYTRERIRRHYNREAEVVPPPVDTARFERSTEQRIDPDAPFLVVSALVPYKRLDLAVQAFAGRRERLIIVGEGADRARLERMAGPNVSFEGWVSDARLEILYRDCRALLHPGLDDFGMVMVEALAAGKPVLAAAEGGAAEIVASDDAGILFEASVGGIRAALDRLPALSDRFEPARLQAQARRFGRMAFRRDFLAVVEKAWQARERQQPEAAAAPLPPLVERTA
jgi:glycosyltransferase involved in cell wall biosynthesis